MKLYNKHLIAATKPNHTYTVQVQMKIINQSLQQPQPQMGAHLLHL